MTRSRLLPFVAVLLASQGCGEVDENATETVQGELGSFGAWVNAGGLLLDSPAIAKTSGTTQTAFGWGMDNQIWTTAQNASGQWTGAWTPLPGGTFTTRPAAVGIDVTSGPFRDHFAIVARRSDSKYYMRIQNQTGSHVAQDWTPVCRGGAEKYWQSAPAIAFVPASNATFADPNLMIVGKHYMSGLLSCPAILSSDGSVGWKVTFTEGLTIDTAPAIAFVPPQFVGQPFLLLAGGFTGQGGITYKISWNIPKDTWEAWRPLPNGVFNSGPAVAAGTQSQFGSEVTLYGRGLDNRIWVTTQVPNGGFSAIGNTTLGSGPTAMGIGNKVTISALSGGMPFTSSANSPF